MSAAFPRAAVGVVRVVGFDGSEARGADERPGFGRIGTDAVGDERGLGAFQAGLRLHRLVPLGHTASPPLDDYVSIDE
jgi:hypothetical protein